jgi:hypothetical protein
MIYLYNPWRQNAAKAAIAALEQRANFEQELYREKSFYSQRDKFKSARSQAIVRIDSDDEVINLSSLEDKAESEGEEAKDREI